MNAFFSFLLFGAQTQKKVLPSSLKRQVKYTTTLLGGEGGIAVF